LQKIESVDTGEQIAKDSSNVKYCDDNIKDEPMQKIQSEHTNKTLKNERIEPEDFGKTESVCEDQFKDISTFNGAKNDK